MGLDPIQLGPKLSCGSEAIIGVEQELVFGELLEAMPDGMVVVDDQGRIESVNINLEQLSGYSREELIGNPIETLVPERFRGGHRGVRENYMSSDPRVRHMGSGLDIRFRRKDGSEFPADIALSPIRSPGGLRVLASVRDITESRRARARLEAVLEISEAILRGQDAGRVLKLVATRARELAGATLATVATPAAGRRLIFAAAEGAGADRLRGLEVEIDRSLAGSVFKERQPLVIADARSDPRADRQSVEAGDLGPMLLVPLMVGDTPFGTLNLANHPGGRHFVDQDVQLVQLFAAQASFALEYSRVREELQRLAVMEDRERIGRELHDGAIQSLFAVGMGLQAAAAMTGDDALKRRLESAVDQVDAVIRDLRNYIFGLRPGLLADRALDQALRHLAQELEEKAGVTAVVEIDPQVGASLANKANDVVQLAGEALSNVARHSGAQTCRLSLSNENGRALLTIEDDGTGFDPNRRRSGGQGLRNLRDRTASLGGDMRIESGREGTTVRFLIPL